jgi:hypothetical protein
MYKKKFPQQKYIYTSRKPEMNHGDSSLESESYNEKEEENEENIIISENCLETSKESKLPPIHIPFNNMNKESFPQYKQGLFFCSATKDTDNGGNRANNNNKEDNFSMKKVINTNKENNRYNNNNINCLYNDNCHFFNIAQLENKEEEEDIVNNEITANFVNELKENHNNKKDKQIEVLLLDNNNISKIEINSEMSNNNNFINNNINRINKNQIYDIKNKNLIKKNKINESVKKIIQKINKNKEE